MSALDIRDVFPQKVICDPNSGCWIWVGRLDSHGYGAFGRCSKAHRESYRLTVGEPPKGLELDHLCRVRCCVNPDHLEPVTHRENIIRGIAPARASAFQRSKTHCKHGHPYSLQNTYVDPRGFRNCRTCLARSAKAQSKGVPCQ